MVVGAYPLWVQDRPVSQGTIWAARCSLVVKGTANWLALVVLGGAKRFRIIRLLAFSGLLTRWRHMVGSADHSTADQGNAMREVKEEGELPWINWLIRVMLV